MVDIIAPAIGEQIIVNGTASNEFFVWIDQVTSAINNTPPLTGSGSPEGVLVADAGRWYVDTGAAAGSGIYFKETGSGDIGWVARS